MKRKLGARSCLVTSVQDHTLIIRAIIVLESNTMIAHEFLENVAKFAYRGKTYNINIKLTKKLRAN
jgi:hypothetical protein